MKKYRVEKDFIGSKRIPIDAYYGVQTKRAFENFKISDIKIGNFYFLINALGIVKKSAALANMEAGLLDKTRGKAIVKACEEIIKVNYADEFIVDAMQGGAGTSTNMNANEVIANLALEFLGHKKGDYKFLSPNNHVNMSQSTNDVYPTALKIALHNYISQLKKKLNYLESALVKKGEEFKDVIKVGRTQLQDAVPMTLAQEFIAFAATIEEDTHRLNEVQNLLLEVNLGATAIGTGINASKTYRKAVIKKLKKVSGLNVVIAKNMIEATSDTGVFVQLSSVLKRVAIKLNKIANDLRLLNSGPYAGFGEITLPMMQPGSSIMPGKINPVIPEMINQIAYEVIGNDLTITLAASNGQLQLNAFEPIMALSLFRNTLMLRRGIDALVKRCINNIVANKERCLKLVLNSNVFATTLTPYLGYEATSLLVKDAEKAKIPICQYALEKGLITQAQLDEILDPKNIA